MGGRICKKKVNRLEKPTKIIEEPKSRRKPNRVRFTTDSNKVWIRKFVFVSSRLQNGLKKKNIHANWLFQNISSQKIIQDFFKLVR